MERVSPEIPQKEKAKTLKSDIVRHGPSPYRQPHWKDPGTADDINAVGAYADGEKSPEELARGKEEAIAKVRKTAEAIASDIAPDEEVILWSSKTGRTLETARIISQVLEEKGIRLRKKGSAEEYGIRTFEKLGEVRNFSWKLFEPLMNGGEVDFGGKKFTIDKALSNPQNLGYPDYFTSDAIRNIPPGAKALWPPEYVREIESFETFAEVTGRMRDVLNRLKGVKDKNYRVIIVTHDALTGSLVKTFTKDQFSGLEPGSFLSLERNGDKLVATRAGDIIEGDSESDVTGR